MITRLDCQVGVPVNLKAFIGCDVTIIASSILGRNAVRISVKGPQETMPVAVERPDLAPRQAEVLDYIAKHRDAFGYSPTVREIGHSMGIKSPNAVVGHINALAQKGYLRHSPGQARSIVLLEAS
jgi:repressor LexA